METTGIEIKVFGRQAAAIDLNSKVFVKAVQFVEGRKVIILGVN